MKTKLITYIEYTTLIGLVVYIVFRWSTTKVSVGDFFCLELLGMMLYYEYDKIKTKLNDK